MSEDDVEFGKRGHDSGTSQEGYGFFSRVTDLTLFSKLRQRAQTKKYFTDRVATDRVTVRLSDIVLTVSPDDRLAFVSHARPTRMGTTGTRGFKANAPITLDIGVDELVLAAGGEYEGEIRRAFKEPSLRPGIKSWSSIWQAIKKLRPDLTVALVQLEKLRFDESFDFGDDTDDELVFCEKDAVGVALGIAGISFGSVFADVAQARTEGKVLIEALCGNPAEDVIVQHDTGNFPAYLKAEDSVERCRFMQRGRNIDIFNVNRRRGERALGVDLVYHNLTYKAFTFVQYKMLEREGSENVPIWRYRPDKSFHAEAGRMRQARRALVRPELMDPDQYRLCRDPFFFKLCRRQRLKVNSGQLANGLYVNLSHSDLVLARGANAFVPGTTLNRWLNRTHFSALVAHGWIGTRAISDADLSAYIEATLRENRSVVVAVAKAQSEQHEGGEDESEDEQM